MSNKVIIDGVEFDVLKSKFPTLSLLHSGTLIDVTGSIALVAGNMIYLTDVELSFSISDTSE